MSAHHDELQDIENVKDFWKRGGKWLFALIIAIALGYWGYTIYQSYQLDKQAEAATLASKIKNNDLAQLQKLQSEHPDAFATAQATLNSSGQYFKEGKLTEAAQGYQWVLEHNQDSLLQATAAKNLAIVYLQQKKYDEALQAAHTPVDAAFQALLDETKGDILTEQGKAGEAKQAYQAALEKLPVDAASREAIQLKINSL